MKKVLFIANTDRHINLCHIPYLKMFKDNGYIVHVATNSNDDIKYCNKKIKLSLKRKPFNFINIKAIIEIRKLCKKEKYDIISCHTPMGGFLGRVGVINQNSKTKVFYIAHGFHFYKGAPLINWLIYYNIEKILSKWTTCILTMNKEDYKIAKDKFHCDVYKINGIGYQKERLIIGDKEKIKKLLNLNNEFIVTYVAEISKRKNQINFLKTLKKYDLEKENIKILLVGDSYLKDFEKQVKKYKNVIYVGFKKDIGTYIDLSDLIISVSTQEGLPLNIMEAMVLNKMIIATDIRGNSDLINNEKNGLLIPVNDLDLFIKTIIDYKNNPNFIINNKMDRYLIDKVLIDVKKIYNKYLGSDKL